MDYLLPTAMERPDALAPLGTSITVLPLSPGRLSALMREAHSRSPAPSGILGGMSEREHVCIVVGAGHVGLPLGLSFAVQDGPVDLVDIDAESIALVSAGRMPFRLGHTNATRRAARQRGGAGVDRV
jgi:hypothetical protein